MILMVSILEGMLKVIEEDSLDERYRIIDLKKSKYKVLVPGISVVEIKLSTIVKGLGEVK